jgi:hypothetical protein
LQLQKKASEEFDCLQKAKEIIFVLAKKPSFSILEYLERCHEKHFNTIYHHNFGLESIRPKTKLKKSTIHIYRTNNWNEQARGDEILARAIVQYCLFILFMEGVVDQIPSYVDSIKFEPVCYFSKVHLDKWSTIYLSSWN